MMTNEQIQEAAKLIVEIAELERLRIDDDGGKRIFKIAQIYGHDVYPIRLVSPLSPTLVKEFVDHEIYLKKARLNDLRGSC